MKTRVKGDSHVLFAVEAGPEPKWNRYLLTGRMFRRDFPDGLELTRADLEKMVANWKAAGAPRLKVDYCHFGSSSDPMPIDQKIASGWIVDLAVIDLGGGKHALDGLTEWTDKARAYITAKEFSCVSPEWAPDAMNPRTGESQGPTFYGAGLLNDPFLTELPRVAASNTTTTHQPTEAAQAKGYTMDKKLICAALGLPDDAEDTAVMAKLGDMAAKCATLPEVTTQMTDKAEKLTFTMAELATAKSELEKLKAEKVEGEIKAFSARLIEKHHVQADKVDALVKMARKNGIEETEAFVAAVMPAAVKMGEVGVSSAEKVLPYADALAALEAEKSKLIAASPSMTRGQAHFAVLMSNKSIADAISKGS